MIARRNFLISASATPVPSPAVVRAASLMPVRGVIFPTEMYYFGFLERLYVHLHLPEITRLQNTGLSAHEIAADMNAHRRTGFIFGNAWDANQVIGVVKRKELIQRTDLIRRRNDGQN